MNAAAPVAIFASMHPPHWRENRGDEDFVKHVAVFDSFSVVVSRIAVLQLRCRRQKNLFRFFFSALC